MVCNVGNPLRSIRARSGGRGIASGNDIIYSDDSAVAKYMCSDCKCIRKTCSSGREKIRELPLKLCCSIFNLRK